MDSEKPFDFLEIEAMLEVERLEKFVWHVHVNMALMFGLEKEHMKQKWLDAAYYMLEIMRITHLLLINQVTYHEVFARKHIWIPPNSNKELMGK